MAKEHVSKRFIEVIPLSMGLIKSYIRSESEVEISFPKYRILGEVMRGAHTVSDLAEVMCVSRPAISKLVDSLVEEGGLSRKPCKKDRRVTYLNATKKGKRLFQKVRGAASKRFVEKLENIDETELENLEKALAVIESFVKKAQE